MECIDHYFQIYLRTVVTSAAHGPTKTRQEAVSLLHSAHLIVVLKNGQVPWKRVVSVVIVVANFFLKKCVPKKELF